jgi:hypothetical protein
VIIQLLVLTLWSLLGFVCNGEFNYLRSKGYTRPVSIFQIRSSVKKKYRKTSKKKLIAMLTPKRMCTVHNYFVVSQPPSLLSY